MIDYLTHPKFLPYNPAVLPSVQGGGGGMGVKTYRTIEALRDVYPRTRGICDSSDIESETVLIEPLRFTLSMNGFEGHENTETLIKGLKASNCRKILYCSELTMLRMPVDMRRNVLSFCSIVTANCQFLANLLRYIGVYTDYILCDPVPAEVFAAPRGNYFSRPNRIVASGNVSWQKNAHGLAKVFEALDGVVERCYIGSKSLWFNASSDKVAHEVEDELYKHTDRIIREATTTTVATEFENCRFGLWIAYHECFATAVHEMMMSGLCVVAANHGLAPYLPVKIGGTLNQQVTQVKKLAAMSNSDLEQQSFELRDWAIKHASYQTFQDQLKIALKAVW